MSARQNTDTLAPGAQTFNRRLVFVFKWILRIVLLGAVMLSILWFTRSRWLPRLYTYLDVSVEPEPADFIVVLGGGANRVPEAARLYQEGMASKLIVGGCGENLTRSLLWLDENDVLEDDILSVDSADSTWEEAQQMLALLDRENATSALVITDPFHVRRAKSTYAHLNNGTDVELMFVAAPDDYSADDWWTVAIGRKQVLREYIKLPYYCLRYGVCSFS